MSDFGDVPPVRDHPSVAAPQPVAPPIAPPVVPGPISAAHRPIVWPSVLGWILTVFGALGIVGGLWGIVSSNMFRMFENLTPPGAPNMMAAMAKWGVWLAILNGIGALIAGLLLAGGIGVLGRRAWSRPAVIAWAWLKIVLALGMSFVTGFTQYDIMQSMAAEMSKQNASGPAPPPGFFTGFGIAMGVVGGVFGILWYSALPVFVLVWFNLKSARTEVAKWDTRESSV